MDKYDDAFKKPQALSKHASNKSLGGGKSLSNINTPNTNMHRNSRRNLAGDNLESGGALSGSMFATM